MQRPVHALAFTLGEGGGRNKEAVGHTLGYIGYMRLSRDVAIAGWQMLGARRREWGVGLGGRGLAACS